MVRTRATASARAKATLTDIYARLARGECANFLNGRCHGASPCTIVEGESCDYFTNYVKPLLDYPEFAGKYGREAKITVALNPKAKVVRKRRTAELALDVPAAPAKTPARAAKSSTAPTPAPAASPARTKQKPAPARPAEAPAARAAAPEHAPATPKKPRARKADAAITTVVSVDGAVREKPRVDRPAARQPRPAPAIPEPAPQLFLELTPDLPKKAGSGRRR